MKKSRIAKFALLGASAAALAATLSTSTYAWYVSNKTANTEAVAGSTATSGVGSSISLSLTGNMNDFHKTIVLGDKANGLSPVIRSESTISSTTGAVTAEYRLLNEAVSPVVPATNATNTEGTTYYEYKFYIKADTQCTVRPTITVTNTTTALPTQINYSGGFQKVTGNSAPTWAAQKYYSYSAGSYTVTTTQPTDWATNYTSYYEAIPNAVTGTTAGSDFYVDAIDALHMSLGMEKGAQFDEANSVTTYSRAAFVGEYAHDVSAIQNYLNVTKATAPSGAALATGGAHNYYEAITGATLDSSAKALYTAEKTTFGNFTNLEANTPYLLVYHLWLDGADDQCFNCCAGQKFSVSFDFTVTA